MSSLPTDLSNYKRDSRFESYHPDIFHIITSDQMRKFVNAVRVRQTMICPRGIAEWVFSFGAMKCAKALLAGKTNHIVDFHCPGSLTQMPPLHVASFNCSAAMVKLLLQHGAPINLRSCSEKKKYDGMLPLNATLYYISVCSPKIEDWSPSKHTVFNLLIRLCLPELRNALVTLKLLVSKTDQALVWEEIYHYAKEGKVVELAALLMVAPTTVLSSLLLKTTLDTDSDSSLQRITLHQLITAHLTLLTSMKVKLGHSKNHSLFQACEEKHARMMPLLLLLGIFDKVGDGIAELAMVQRPQGSQKQVVDEVASLLVQAGFPLTHKDVDLSDACKEKPRYGNMMSQDVVDEQRIKDCELLDLAMQQFLELNIFQIHEQKENANLQKPTAKDCKLLKAKPNSFKFLPYAQWRFASNKHLHGSVNHFVRAFYTLQDSKDMANMRFNNNESMGQEPPSLSAAIERLCGHHYLKDWNPKKSVFKLLYVLCLPKMKEELEHIKLLVYDAEEIKVIACHYAMEGRATELAIMLMVAREKLIPLIASQRSDITNLGESMVIHRCVMSEIQKLFNDEISLAGTSQRAKAVLTCKAKKEKLLSVLTLLEVFQRAGDTFERYLISQRFNEIKEWNTAMKDVPQDVALLLKDLGFILKRKDTVLNDLNCFANNLVPEQLENLSRSLLKETDVPVDLQPCKFSVMKRKPVIGTLNGYLRPSASCSTCILPTSISPVRSFHTFQTSKASSGMVLYMSLENQVSSAPRKAEPQLSIFSNRKQWASFAMAIRKATKRI